MLPPSVRAAIERELNTTIVKSQGVGGGCISPNARIETKDGTRGFVKWASPGQSIPGFFEAEAFSLSRIAQSRTIRVPRVLHATPDWLLLEWIDPGTATKETWRLLGERLAAMHQVRAAQFGWDHDNFIGTLPQANGRLARWAEFWVTRRLVPMFEMAAAAGHFNAEDTKQFEQLCARAEDVLSAGDADGASLLHGDLWNGNLHITRSGEPALIDPSSYFGHREVDLAMAELFGGFDQDFFAAYDEAWALLADYNIRRNYYQLYYLLVHVNIFGGGYVEGARRCWRS